LNSKNQTNRENKNERYQKFKKIYLDKSKLPPGRYSIIQMIEKMTLHFIEQFNMDFKIPDHIYFKCNKCGKCCQNARYKVPITILDCANWINLKKKFILRALDHNRGHPKNLLFFITKKNFEEYMVENYGKSVFEHFLNLNPSLTNIKDENLEDCVFFNSNNNNCVIYQFRPLHCQIYPYYKLFNLDLRKIYSKGYKLVSKMNLKDKDFKEFLRNNDIFRIKCPPEVLEENKPNFKKIKKSFWSQKIRKLIIADLFSGTLYFKNRRDILELIYYSLFSKRFSK